MPSVSEEKTIKQSIHDRTVEKREKKKEFRGSIPVLRYSAFDGRHKNAVYDKVEKAKRRNVAEGAQVYRRSYNMPLANWAMSLR